ncbi:hypothetical protein CDL15_Pgr013035 [Punica granatum]|uniref:Uncharacterized protein n=1 Tax=Punica granatum TaxID=22663 RepID=A0A218WIC1_PUNGR|nr:hypothetical protein CDL15_Pgr013035 [Punica granatum]
MPNFYKEGEYDLSGFAVGGVEKGSVIDGKSIVAVDILIGLPSSGVHLNGFSFSHVYAASPHVLEVKSKINFVSSGHACARLNATRLGSVHLPGDARRTHVKRSRHLPFYDPKIEGRQVTQV